MRRARPVLLALGLASVATAIALACTPTQSVDPSPSTPIASVTPMAALDASPIVVVADAGATHTRSAPERPEVPTQLTYAADGTLVVTGVRSLVARAPSGATQKVPIPKMATTTVDPVLPGVVIDDGKEITLLATPALTPLFRGRGRAVPGAGGAIEVADQRVVVLQKDARLVRLDLTTAPADAHVDAIRAVAGGTRYDVTLSTVGNDGIAYSAILFDDQGAKIGRGVTVPWIASSAPPGAVAGAVGFAVEGRKVLRVDLRTGAIVRQAVVGCGKDKDFGNPTPSPNADLLLLTCGDDGVVLDGVTLAERRRIPRIMPGCDNGSVLGGSILADGRTLRVDGCGGTARLDVTAGVYRCSDNVGLVGAPYEGMGPSNRAPRVVPGRERLPPCTPNLDQSPTQLGTSGRYTLLTSNKRVVQHAGGRIVLEEEALDVPVVSPDEKELAYVLGKKVVVRSLPDGAVRATFEPF